MWCICAGSSTPRFTKPPSFLESVRLRVSQRRAEPESEFDNSFAQAFDEWSRVVDAYNIVKGLTGAELDIGGLDASCARAVKISLSLPRGLGYI